MGSLYLPPSKRKVSQASKVRLYGDRARAQEIARLHLNRLWVAFRQLCSFQNLQQNMQRIDFAEGPYKGGFALLRKTFGEESAEIFVPETEGTTRYRRPVESRSAESHTFVHAQSFDLDGGVKWRYVHSGGSVPNYLIHPWNVLGNWDSTIPGGETNEDVGFTIHGTSFPDGPPTGGTKTVQYYIVNGASEVGDFPYLPGMVQTFSYSEDYFYDFYYDLTLYKEPASASGGWHLSYTGEGMHDIGFFDDVLLENPNYHVVLYQKFDIEGQADQAAALGVNPLNGELASPTRGEVTATETKTHTQVLVINGYTILTVPESEGKISSAVYHYRGFSPAPEPGEKEVSVSYSGLDEITTIREQFKSEVSLSDEILTSYVYGVSSDGIILWRRYGCMIGTDIAADIAEDEADGWRSIGEMEWNPVMMSFRAPGLVTRTTQIIKKPEQEV